MDMKLANKQLQVLRFPKYLILHLNRFKNGAKGKVKNHEPIEYEEY
jgi:ubiquitin C-terminal hydrolase